MVFQSSLTAYIDISVIFFSVDFMINDLDFQYLTVIFVFFFLYI